VLQLKLCAAIVVISLVTTLSYKVCWHEPDFRSRDDKCDNCKDNNHRDCRYQFWIFRDVHYCRCCGINDWN
jgi:hypothetical protein